MLGTTHFPILPMAALWHYSPFSLSSNSAHGVWRRPRSATCPRLTLEVRVVLPWGTGRHFFSVGDRSSALQAVFLLVLFDVQSVFALRSADWSFGLGTAPAKVQNKSFGLISRWSTTLPSGAHNESFGSMFGKFAGEECRMDVLVVKCTTTLPTDLQRKKVFVLTCARVYMTLDPLPHLVPVETVSLKYI